MRLSTIWKRRIVLMAIVGLLVAIPVTLLVRDSDDGDAGQAQTAGSDAAGSQPKPTVGPGLKDQGLAASYRVPDGWRESRRASAIRLRSEDGTAEIVIAAPAGADEAQDVLDEAIASIREGYDEVDVAPGEGRQVGGLDATGAVVSAKAEGQSLQILLAVAPGKERTYLVEVFTTGGVSAQSLREAQVALNSLDLKG